MPRAIPAGMAPTIQLYDSAMLPVPLYLAKFWPLHQRQARAFPRRPEGAAEKRRTGRLAEHEGISDRSGPR
eukprot:3611765-Pyramimonas_sp.AAC.1